MLFVDPADTVGLELPTGWALDIVSSSPTALVFSEWHGPATRNLFVRLRPTQGVGTVSAWVDAVRGTLPPDAISVQVTDVRAPVIWVARPGREGRPDQRWAIVRGPVCDVTLEDVGVPLGGSTRTPVLELAVDTLVVPANGGPASRRESTWNELMDRADEQMARGDVEAGLGFLNRARRWVLDAWRNSLVDADPQPRLLIAAAHSLLRMAGTTKQLGLLDDATVLLMRASRGLDDDADQQAARALMENVLRLHHEAGAESVPKDAVRAAFARADLAVRAVLGGALPSAPDADVTSGARLALRIAAQCLVLASRLRGSSLTNEQFDAAGAFGGRALELMTICGSVATATRTAAGQDPEPDLAADWVFAARELMRRDDSAVNREGLALALNAQAAAMMTIGDRPSLETSDALLEEARAVLPAQGGERATGDDGADEVRSQLWLNRAWVDFHLGRNEEALTAADHVVPASSDRAAPAPIALARSVASVRSAALLKLGRTADALDAARAAVGEDDPAESAHRLNLAAVLHASGQDGEGLEQVRLGLAAAMREYPFSPTVLRLLFLLAEILDAQRPGQALEVTKVAQDLQDYQTRWLPNTPDVAGFQEVEYHRALSASLVLRLLRSGDILGALAAADHARAKTMAPGWNRTGPGDETVPPMVSGADTSLEELVAGLRDRLTRAMGDVGLVPLTPGSTLTELVDASGRTTLLLHPTPEGLVRFLLRPSLPPQADVIPADADAVTQLTGRLRQHLGITLVTRAARGELPTPDDIAVAAELQALADTAEDDEQAMNEAQGESGADSIDDDLQVLGQLLLDGLDLEDGEPLAFVPYRELAMIPLSALVLPDGRRLAATHPPSAMPSIASVLGATRTSPPDGTTMRAVVVGDPATDPGLKLPALAGARTEGQTVASLLKRTFQVDTLVGPQATEPTLRELAYGAHLLHFACHAAIREPAEESALFLAPGPYDDGRLKVTEVDDLLVADALVVLAACETGLGRITPDGIQGLGQAFLRGGARSIVLSLWPVGDAATGHLMAAFYAALLGTHGERADVSQALAQAQTVTMAAFPLVTQWAPWILVGDGRWRL